MVRIDKQLNRTKKIFQIKESNTNDIKINNNSELYDIPHFNATLAYMRLLQH